MDSFRGSIPPNFISFRLENQTTEVASTPAAPPINVPTVNPPTEQGRQVQDPTPSQETHRSRVDDVTSTHSADSDPDVTAYAENMVRQLEGAQVPDQPQGGAGQIEPAQDIVPSTQGDLLPRLLQGPEEQARHSQSTREKPQCRSVCSRVCPTSGRDARFSIG